MIDVATFSNSYSALWHSYTPTCDLFVKRLNLDMYDRFDRDMPSAVGSDRRALVAEFAFLLFASQITLNSPANTSTDALWNCALERLARFSSSGGDTSPSATEEELQEAGRIRDRLRLFFRDSTVVTTINPSFPGCGYVDTSEGDILYGATLYEVKTVDRPFRSSDVRQLLTYAALNSLTTTYDIQRIGVVNPRRGTSWNLSLDVVSTEVSGRTASELLWLLTSALSSGELSR